MLYIYMIYTIQHNIILTIYLLGKKKNADGGVRTHEACALVLKTNPFDHSGTSAFEKIQHLKRNPPQEARIGVCMG